MYKYDGYEIIILYFVILEAILVFTPLPESRS